MSIIKPHTIPYAFQPIFMTKGKDCENIFGYEALARPVGFENPGEYIKSMTRAKKLHKLEFETFYNALYQFNERGLEGNLFINSFPYEYLTDDEFEFIRSVSPDHFKNIYVESLEYGSRVDILRLAVKLDVIRKNGFHLVVDDFGTGINSIRTLNVLHPDIIKIDRSYISGCTESQKDMNTVEIITDCIRSHGAKALAEGVETEDEYSFLSHLGIDYMQGYYLGVPK